MLLLKVFKFKKLYQEFKANPSKAGGAEAVDMLREIFLVPKIIGLVLLALFFVLGFTSLLTDPVLVCKILFWILLPVYLIMAIIMRVVLKIVRRTVEKAVGKVM